MLMVSLGRLNSTDLRSKPKWMILNREPTERQAGGRSLSFVATRGRAVVVQNGLHVAAEVDLEDTGLFGGGRGQREVEGLIIGNDISTVLEQQDIGLHQPFNGRCRVIVARNKVSPNVVKIRLAIDGIRCPVPRFPE